MKLKIKDIVKETEDAISLTFTNGNLFSKLSYKSGQFLTLHVPIEGVVHKRAYSFSSSTTDKDLKITVKRVDKGLVSNHLHDFIKIGDKIEVDKPAGSFHHEPNKTTQNQYVFFAGGSGITPIYSIIQSILNIEDQSKILLVYANQNLDSIIFHENIKLLVEKYPNNFFTEHIISSGKFEQENYHLGLISETLLNTIFSKYKLSFDNNVYMICGPFGYMEKVKELLKSNNVSRDKIKIEVFKAPKVKLIGKDLISNVTLRVNGSTHDIKVKGDVSILRQAMSDNIVLPYSCRSGMCSTCKARCISGEIKMIDGHFLDEEAVNNGEILTCVSYPVSESVVIEL